jgi:hypothetical protein
MPNRQIFRRSGGLVGVFGCAFSSNFMDMSKGNVARGRYAGLIVERAQQGKRRRGLMLKEPVNQQRESIGPGHNRSRCPRHRLRNAGASRFCF